MGVSDVFTRIGIVNWLLSLLALLVKEYMEINKPSGFQLVEVKNNLSDKVYEVEIGSYVDHWNPNLQRKVAVVASSLQMFSIKQAIVHIIRANHS